MPKKTTTDTEVEIEITRLLNSPFVKLAKKEQAVRYKRRQYMYSLRWYENRGKQLAAEGVTLDTLCKVENDTEAELSNNEEE